MQEARYNMFIVDYAHLYSRNPQQTVL